VFTPTSSPNPTTIATEPARISVETYREANPAEIATPDQSRFYDPAYRIELRKMVDHVIGVEGPLYFDLLVDRISRAHGFQRAKHMIRDIIRSALRRGRYPQTQDDGQELIWPIGADTHALCPWRGSGGRRHNQIPLIELASLANVFQPAELDDEAVIRTMQDVFGLGRLANSTRGRFQSAIGIARRRA
jgi:Protein of unknown function (DUF3320)